MTFPREPLAIRLTKSGVWLSGLVMTFGLTARAAELSYSLAYSMEQSNNVQLAPVGSEQEETISSVMLSARFLEQLPSFRSEIAASSEYRNYREEVFQDETLFYFDGTAVWIPRPYFSWTIADSHRNVPVSRALPNTPVNREDTNVFIAGPSFDFRFSSVDNIVADVRYGRFDAEDVDIDNDRYSAALRWIHGHSASAQSSINYEHLRVEFDNDLVNTNYTRKDLFYEGRYERSRNELTLNLGYTEIDRERLPKVDGSLLRLSAVREVSSVRHLGVVLSSEYTDTAFSLAPSGIATAPPISGPPASVAPGVLTGEVFYVEQAEVFAADTGSPFTWSMQVYKRDTDYEGVPADSDDTGGALNCSYVRSASVSFDAYANYSRIEYPALPRTDRDTVTGLRANFRVRRSFVLSLEGQRAERESTDPLFSYADDRLFLRLTYSATRFWN